MTSVTSFLGSSLNVDLSGVGEFRGDQVGSKRKELMTVGRGVRDIAVVSRVGGLGAVRLQSAEGIIVRVEAVGGGVRIGGIPVIANGGIEAGGVPGGRMGKDEMGKGVPLFVSVRAQLQVGKGTADTHENADTIRANQMRGLARDDGRMIVERSIQSVRFGRRKGWFCRWA